MISRSLAHPIMVIKKHKLQQHKNFYSLQALTLSEVIHLNLGQSLPRPSLTKPLIQNIGYLWATLNHDLGGNYSETTNLFGGKLFERCICQLIISLALILSWC